MSTDTTHPEVQADVVKKITNYLADDLAEVGRILRETIATDSEIIQEVGDYLAITPGKKLRPMLTLLVSKAIAPDRPAPLELAASLELIHAATLIHDDVIDEAETRRGKPSVNAKWGDDVAILMADFLYAGSFNLALSTVEPTVLRSICQVSQRMCEGEMLQIKLRNKTYTTEEYLEIVGRKTASLFSACTALGAHISGADIETVDAARSFGYDFGIAFQITDDILDFTADPDQFGKEIGMDLLGGKQTLPFLLALDGATPQDRSHLERWLTNGRNIDGVLETVERYDGIQRSIEIAREYADRAQQALDRLPVRDTESYDCLASLSPYVLSRTY